MSSIIDNILDSIGVIEGRTPNSEVSCGNTGLAESIAAV